MQRGKWLLNNISHQKGQQFESVEEKCESDYMKYTLYFKNKNTDEWMV